MDSFSVETTITLADWQSYLWAFGRKLQAESNSPLQTILYGLAAGAGAYALLLALHVPIQIGSLFGGLAIGIGLVWIGARRNRGRTRPDADGMVLGSRTMKFDSNGIKIEHTGWSALIDWSCLREVEIEPNHLYIWVDRISAYIVPLRDLPPGMTAADAAARIRAFATQAAAQSNDSQQSVPAPLSPDQPEAASTLADTRSRDAPAASKDACVAQPNALARAIGFLTFRYRKRALDLPTDRAIAGFAAGGLLLWLLLDRLRYGPDAEFVPYEAPAFTWYLIAGLLAAWLASRLTRPRVEFRSVLFLLVVLAPVLIACEFLLGLRVGRTLQAGGALALVVYTIAYLETGLRSITGQRQIRAALTTVSLAVVFVFFNSNLYVYPTLWTEPDPESAENSATSRNNAEELLISQPARIGAQLAHVIPAATTNPSVYFVGFAGVGRQRVFAEEIKLAARQVAARYGSSDRTVLLLNDRRDVDSYPLATVTGLKLALKGVAARMNLDQDVLFLALSSHGSAQPSISVSNGYLPLRDLSGADLADALRASGIKWKVIVISACYSGAFIDSLRDDNTIILTAAAAATTAT
jgi:Peptidase C13 family